MDESLALLRQISLSLQALSLEVHRQGRTLSRVQELVEELHPGADYELVSQPPAPRASSSSVLPAEPAFSIGASPASSAPVASPAAGYPGAEGSEAHRSAISEEERREIARSIGAFFRRCLDGLSRGTSGRDRNPLQSRCYVVVADYKGQRFNPPLLFDQFSPVKELCKKGSATGSSIFCGFPAQWEAKLACEAAGLSLPIRPSDVRQQ